LVLIGLGCMVYLVGWASFGRKLLKREIENLA